MATDRGILRFARATDAPGVLDIYAPIVRDTPISFETEPPSVDEMQRRIVETQKMFPWLVCERAGAVAGYAYASRHRERKAYQWSVDVACYVHENARGTGVGKRLYTALLRILARQGFHSAFGIITLPNDASVALHESVGFRRIAVYPEVGYKAGAWRDTSWFHRVLAEATPEPADPRPLGALGPGVLDDP